MLHCKKAREVRCTDPRSGFALVIALGLMAFVLLLLLSISTMVQVNVEGAKTSKELLLARQNALFGVQVALGELQRQLGPDQRVSASSAVLDPSPSTEAADGIQSNWTGVWNALDWDVSTVPPTIDTNLGKPTAFRKWLVSLASEADQVDPDLPARFDTTSAASVQMVSGLRDTPAVYAEEVELSGSAGVTTKGSFAWWVGDENTKASLVYDDLSSATSERGDLYARSKSAGSTLPKTIDAFKDIDAAGLDAGMMVSRDGFGLTLRKDSSTDSPWDQAYFHDFTPWSQGLLTDVVNGGFKRDLSSLFESDSSLPAEFEDQPLYTNGPVWEVLQRHYMRYKDISYSSTGVPYYDARESQMTSSDLWDTTLERDYIIPVPFRVQYLFSIAVDKWDLYTDEGLTRTADPNAPISGSSIYYLVMKPVVVLWNPYNVEMRWTMPNKRSILYLSMGTPPVEISFDGGSNYRSLESIFWDYNKTLFVGEMQKNDDIVIQPGETIILSLADKTLQQHRMLIPNTYYNDNTDGTYGIYQGAGLNSRNNNMQTGWDDDVVGFHSPLLTNQTADDAADQFISASTNLNIKIRYKSTATSSADQNIEFATHMNAGSESDPGVSDMGRLATIEFRESSPGNSSFLSTEYDLGSISSTGLSIEDSGAENSFLFSITAEKKVFGYLSSGGKLGTYLDPRIPYYYTTDFSSAENVLAPIEFKFNEKGTESLFQFEPTKGIGYFGSLIEAIYGVTTTELPLSPMSSILELRHAPLGWDYGHAIFRQTNWAGRSTFSSGESGDEFAAIYNQALGNAYAHPLMAVDALQNSSRSRSVDHSYLQNSILPESYFFSGITARDAGDLYTTDMTAAEAFSAWTSGTVKLAEGRYLFNQPDDLTVAEVSDILFQVNGDYEDDFYEKIASYITVNGMFNVNSTSVNAWRAVLAGLRDVEVPLLASGATSVTVNDVTDTPFGRQSFLTGEALADSADVFDEAVRFWNGFRTLSDDEIKALSESIVAEVKQRGPFRSMGQFFNREVSARAAYNTAGAVQSAIESSGVNNSVDAEVKRTELSSIPSISYPNNDAFYGGSGEGTNGVINQADVLSPIAPYLSVRGDTFIIRSRGESISGLDRSVSVYCEAVFTRNPEYVGDGLDPELIPDSVSNPIQSQFGRQFTMVSFRWINSDEI
jgi:hypothetical protein